MSIATIEITVQQELELIRKQAGGVLRPSDVVAYAQDPETALHGKFTWDDDEAAHQYRLWQARELIRVVVTVLSDGAPAVRAYVSLMDDRQEDGGGYRTILNVLRNPSHRAALLDQAKKDMKRFEQKYKLLEEMAGVIDAMRQARRR